MQIYGGLCVCSHLLTYRFFLWVLRIVGWLLCGSQILSQRRYTYENIRQRTNHLGELQIRKRLWFVFSL